MEERRIIYVGLSHSAVQIASFSLTSAQQFVKLLRLVSIGVDSADQTF